MLLFFFLPACSDQSPAWAVHHASVVPAETGLSGTQTWEFFTSEWARTGSADAYVCGRAQVETGSVTAALPGCEGCVVAYALALSELESDCEAPLDTDEAYTTPTVIGIGDLPEEWTALDPFPGRSLGWYVSLDGVEMQAYGFAYPETLEWAGALGSPGWATGQTYTLWPAYAWDLR